MSHQHHDPSDVVYHYTSRIPLAPAGHTSPSPSTSADPAAPPRPRRPSESSLPPVPLFEAPPAARPAPASAPTLLPPSSPSSRSYRKPPPSLSLASPARLPPSASSRTIITKRTRIASHDPQYVDLDETNVAAVSERDGPVLRRGSKRLSELPSEDEAEGSEERSISGGSVGKRAASSVGRRIRTGKSSAGSVLKKKSGGGAGRPVLHERGISNLNAAAVLAEKQQSPSQQQQQQQLRSPALVQVVVHDFDHKAASTAGSEIEWDGPQGEDWERIRRETTCRPERMNWSMVDYEGWFPRLLHILYPFFVFAHVPAQLFLDYNLLYLLVQLGFHPSLPSASSPTLITRALVDVPNIKASTGWWVAVGIYSVCTAVWFFGVVCWREVLQAIQKGGGAGKAFEIEKVYTGSASFNLACIRSFSIFSCLWRIRLAPYRLSSPLAGAVEETTRWDGVKETFAWYRQNWPTVFLLLPRAGLSVALLLLFSTTAYGSSTAITATRDSTYYSGNGTLTAFSTGVLFANAAWAAWKLLVVLVSWFGLWAIDRPSLFLPKNTAYSQSLERLTISSPLPFNDKMPMNWSTPGSLRRSSVGGAASTWRTRRQRRLRAAILATLGSTPLTSSSSFFSPYLKSPYVNGHSPTLSRGGKSVFTPNSHQQSAFSPGLVGDIARPPQDEGVRRRASFVYPAQDTDRIVVESESGPMMSSPRRVDGLWESQAAHRRIRSLPSNNDNVDDDCKDARFSHPAVIDFSKLPKTSLASLPYLSSPPSRPNLHSHFSAFSSGANTPTPVEHLAPFPWRQPPPLTRQTTSSSFASPSPFIPSPSPSSPFTPQYPFPSPPPHELQQAWQPPSASAALSASTAFPAPPNLSFYPSIHQQQHSSPDPALAARSLVSNLESNLASNQVERQHFSAQLFDEVQRLQEAEAALDWEERRRMGLERNSLIVMPLSRRRSSGESEDAEEEEEEEESTSASASADDDFGSAASHLSISPSAHTVARPAHNYHHDHHHHLQYLSQPPSADIASEVVVSDPRHSVDTASTYSLPSSISAHSERSTLRGGSSSHGAVRTTTSSPSAAHALSLGGGGGYPFPATPREEDSGELGTQRLEPFMLSYGSDDGEGMSLSAYGSPMLVQGGNEDDEEEQEGQEVPPPPVEKD